MSNIKRCFLLLVTIFTLASSRTYSAELSPRDDLTITGQENLKKIKDLVQEYSLDIVKSWNLMMGMNLLQFVAAHSKDPKVLDYLIEIGFDKSVNHSEYGDLLQIAVRMNANINMITHLLVNHGFNRKKYAQSLESLAKDNENKIIAYFLKGFEKKSMNNIKMIAVIQGELND